MIKVYIASPYTLGDQARNVYESLEVGNQLIELGFCPFCPLLTHFQHMMFPQDYDKWLKLDFEWLKQCDCVLRITGESKGADEEVQLAESLNIPVFYYQNNIINDLIELIQWSKA
jgi:nucleoside 2-deoxyribosyltransferase